MRAKALVLYRGGIGSLRARFRAPTRRTGIVLARYGFGNGIFTTENTALPKEKGALTKELLLKGTAPLVTLRSPWVMLLSLW